MTLHPDVLATARTLAAIQRELMQNAADARTMATENERAGVATPTRSHSEVRRATVEPTA